MTDGFSLQQFLVREADWVVDGNLLSNIRRLVFIVEQSVPQEEEWDGRDETAWHWLATDHEDAPIGTARLLPDGQIGRMAVLGNYRGTGVGAAMLEAAVEKARHLGFPAVYLHAQVHARGFYERLGFQPEGDEFDDAGIAHVMMRQTLEPLSDNVQRVTAITGDADMTIKPFDTREISLREFTSQVRQVRMLVLRQEMKLPEGYLAPPDDTDANHWIAEDENGQVIGCIRMTVTGEISHLAVLEHYRRRGVGHSLLELCKAKALRYGLEALSLYAPVELRAFLERAGYASDTDTGDAPVPDWQKYHLSIVAEDVHEPLQRPQLDRHYTESDDNYHLGEDKKLILLRREEDFREIILEMCRQATMNIRIFSPVLEHKLFDRDPLMDVVSALARRNRYTQVEILLYDSHRVVKNGHALLNISRKLPSSIGMKIVHPELRQLNHEYVIADQVGVIYRLDYEDYDGWANFNDVTEANRLTRQFTAAWESGLLDPNLRQLRI